MSERIEPFLKWPGGKRRVADKITAHFPTEIWDYHEPFVGGGAVYFSIWDKIKGTAYLSDRNIDLIQTYYMVRTKVDAVIDQLKVMEKLHKRNPDFYYEVRNKAMDNPLTIACRLIYLNKTCFNGLYRVNRKGHFNVSKGDYKNPTICNETQLREASRALQNAMFMERDFAQISVRRGDTVYADPPYDGGFTSYTEMGFDADDQTRLRDTAVTWMGKGVRVVVSNAATDRIRTLWHRGAGFTQHPIDVQRSISRSATGRKPAKELIITGGVCFT